MINKPIKLVIRLSYTQAIVLLNQLQHQLNNKEIRISPEEEEMSYYKRWKEEHKTDD